MQKKDTSAVLRQCMTKLSAEHREIIDLVYYHEKSVEEVAKIVGVPGEHREDAHVLCAQAVRGTAQGSGSGTRLAMIR